MKICLKCLKYHNDENVYCPDCKEPLADVDSTNQVYSEQQTQYVANGMTSDSLSGKKTVYGGSPSNNYVNPNTFDNRATVYDNKNVNQINYAGANNEYVTKAFNTGSNMQNRTDVPGIQNEAIFMSPATESQNVGNNKNNNTALYVLIGIFAGIIVIAGIIILFLIMDNNRPVYYETPAVQTQLETTTEKQTKAETTTVTVPETTTKANVPDANKLAAYYVFNDFYSCYLDGINYLNADMLEYCSATVRNEMRERFEYNQKSLFDLRRIDFDEASYSSRKSGNITYHSFYVKCVSEYYDRDTLANKGLNYAVWYVTVTEDNGYSYVSALERNDKYKMGSVVHTITDYAELPQLHY